MGIADTPLTVDACSSSFSDNVSEGRSLLWKSTSTIRHRPASRTGRVGIAYPEFSGRYNPPVHNHHAIDAVRSISVTRAAALQHAERVLRQKPLSMVSAARLVSAGPPANRLLLCARAPPVHRYHNEDGDVDSRLSSSMSIRKISGRSRPVTHAHRRRGILVGELVERRGGIGKQLPEGSIRAIETSTSPRKLR